MNEKLPEKLKLIHLANFNSTNIGNGALITGLENVVSEDFSREIEWIREAWDDYTFGFKDFDEKFVDLVNRSDGLVINGAVAIHGRQYLKRTGMRFELTQDLIDKVKKPIIFYGISYRHFYGQVFYHAETLKNTISFLVKSSNVLMGVRNDGTKKWLEQTLKLDKSIIDHIHDVPDTGVFTSAKPGYYPEILGDRPVIIFSPNDEDRIFRYGNDNVEHFWRTGYFLQEKPKVKAEGQSWIKNRKLLIDQISDALTRILIETGGQLLLVPHYLDDYRFIADLVDRLEPQIAHQCSISTGLMRIQGTEYFYGRYQRADLAISMRIHSMSPCIGLGVPMIPLVTQPRMWDFLRDIGLEDIGLDAFSDNIKKKLVDESSHILSNPKERKEKFISSKSQMRARLKRMNLKIQKILIS